MTSLRPTGALPAVARSLVHRPAVIAAGYVAAYLLLDWVSFIHPVAELAITPWNPPPGLTIVLLLLGGPRYLPAVLLAPYLAELAVRHDPPLAWTTLLGALAPAIGYGAAGALLAGPLRMNPALASLRDAAALTGVALVAPLGVGLAYIGVHLGLGNLVASQAPGALLQFWIGDAIGIVVTTPLLLEATRWRSLRERFRVNTELALQVAALVLSLWIVFGLVGTDKFRFFYLLFLPLVWIALRRGLEGAVAASLAIQLVIIIASDRLAEAGYPLRDLQFLMLTLALTALYLGVTVRERAAAVRALVDRDAALNRALRTATAGELATAVAHELNQPLSAAHMYMQACTRVAGDPAQDELFRETLAKATREVARSSEVVRRLRDFYRSGAVRRERVPVAVVVRRAVESVAARAQREGIAISVEDAGTAALYADPVQIQLVLHNLLTNAIDALRGAATHGGRIGIAVRERAGGAVVVEIADNGPGVPGAVLAHLFEPLPSGKSGGMGVGLAISRSVAEAHGGSLALASTGASGTIFELTIPVRDGDA